MTSSFIPGSWAYQSRGGHTVIIDSDGPLSALAVTTRAVRGVVTATVTAENPSDYDLGAAVWSPGPAASQWSGQRLKGASAAWKPSQTATTVTVTVPARGGKSREVTVDVVKSTGYVSSTMEHSTIRGAGTVPVEWYFGFTRDVTLPARLYRVARGTLGSSVQEETLIEERQVTFQAGKAQKITRQVDFPAPPAGSVGQGYEFEWRVYPDGVDGPRTVVSDRLMLWVIGDAPEAAAPDPRSIPQLDRPDLYKRPATSFGRVTPSPGKTDTDMQKGLVEAWNASEKDTNGNNVWTNLGGAWLNTTAFGAAVYLVDLDDTTIPKRTVTYFDEWEFGWGEPKGWYGRDDYAKPWPQEQTAIDVPIPEYARPSFGTDRAMTIVGVRGGQVEAIWEMWLARRRADGTWYAASCGKAENPNWQQSFSYTTSASGIAMPAGGLLISAAVRAIDYIKAEKAAGRTPSKTEAVKRAGDHCLAAALANPSGRAISWPATHNDGTHWNTTYPVEGQWVYLDQSLDINAQGYSNFQWLLAAILQVKGAFVTDRTNSNTAIALEVDTAYEPGKKWADLVLTPGWNNERFFKVPDWAWVPGKIYTDEASFRADFDPSPSLTSTATTGAGGTATLDWTWNGTNPSSWTVARDGTDTSGAGDWSGTVAGTTRTTTFTDLREGDTYRLTVTGAGQTSTATVTIPVTTPTTTYPRTDTLNTAFTGGGQTSQYHAWATGVPQTGAGLVVWLHGDAAYEHNNPDSTYVFGGEGGVRAAGRNAGCVVVSALAPDTSGTVTWWEGGTGDSAYLAALLEHLCTTYGVPRSRIALCGFSGGAQQITQFFMDAYPDWLQPGSGTIVFGGGEAPDGAPVYTTATKTGVWMHWAAGELDTAANATDGFDGRGAAEYGEQWFRGQGFAHTSIEIVPGQYHELDNFGSILAQQLTKIGSTWRGDAATGKEVAL